jgi:hypothetical protein
MAGWNGDETLNPGDIVYFDSAGTWGGGSEMYLLTLTGGVTYDGNSWGTGTRATLRPTSSLSQAVVTFLSDDPSNPTVIRGFEIDASIGRCTGISCKNRNDMTGAVKRIENCHVHDCDSSYGYWYGIELTPSRGSTHSNFEIIDCVVWNIQRTGITLYPDSSTMNTTMRHILVRGCETYHTGLDRSSAGCGIALKNRVINAVVEYNYIHDSLGSSDSGGIGIMSQNSSFPGPEKPKVRYNIVENCPAAFSTFYDNSLKEAEIYGNLFMHNDNAAMSFITDGSNLSVRIYNNTFYRNCRNTSLAKSYEVLFYFASAQDFIMFEFVNNLVCSDSGKMAFLCEDISRVTRHSNNLYYRPDGGDLVFVNGTNKYSAANINEWEPTARTGSPGFKNESDLPAGFTGTYGVDMRPAGDGLSIISGDAVGYGIDLGSSFNGAINLSGKSEGDTRPSGGWDIGAYDTLTGSGSGGGGDGDEQNPLDRIKVWPNPLISGTGKQVRFTNLPSDSSVKIYTLSGKLVSSMTENGGQTYWTGRNKDGKQTSPGLYLYMITEKSGNNKTGKIAIFK